jgi:ATP-dependent DNA ligase
MSDELVLPARCVAGLPEDLNKPYLVSEEKLDGSRYVLHIGADPYGRREGNTLLSRRFSVGDGKLVDRTENVPHITGVKYAGLEGTVLDGEIMASDFLGTNSVMNSGPALAVQKQNESGKLNYHVFDIMVFRGKDIRGLPLEKRRKILEEAVRRMNNEYVKVIEQKKSNFLSYFKLITARGGEGLIIKDIRQGYGCGWSKMKKTYDVSVVVSGFKPGNGKYAGQVGALALSVYHEGELLEVGFCSGFDDTLRSKITKDPDAYMGRVIDVFAQEVQKSKRSGDNPVGRLRHPTFHRFRDDMNANSCTGAKLLEDLKKRTKFARDKVYD